MKQCAHKFIGDETQQCPHPATPGSDYCIWHNDQLIKSDAYVVQLLQQAINFSQGDIREFSLDGLIWRNADLKQIDADRVDLRDADLQGAQLQDASLIGANLRRTDLSKANLSNADLRDADLRNTNLRLANLKGANLSGTLIDGTNFLGANLENSNLENADIQSFTWNGLTNFSGIHGFETDTQSETVNDEDETKEFIAPLALGSIENLSHKKRSSISEIDPRLRESHIFQRPQFATSDAAPAPSKEPSLHIPTDFHTEQIGREKKKENKPKKNLGPLISILVAAAVIVTLLPTALGVWAYNKMLDFRDERENLRIQLDKAQIQTRGESSIGGTSTIAQEQLLLKNKENLELRTQLQHAQEAHKQNAVQIQHLQEEISSQHIELGRLRIREDQIRLQDIAHNDLRRDLDQLLAENNRLRKTSEILARGVERLENENKELVAFRSSRLQEAHAFKSLQLSADELRQEKASLEAKTATLAEDNNTLRQRLQEAELTMTTFLARIDGSRLQDLVSHKVGKQQGIPVVPGEAIVFGGDYLLTLTVTPDESNKSIHSELVLQRPAHRALPDITLVFYDERGQHMRSISYSLPQSEGRDPFVTAKSTISGTHFPATARIIVNPPLEQEKLAQNKAFNPDQQ